MCRRHEYIGWVICINSICPTSKKWDLGMKINFPKYGRNIWRSPPSVFELRLLQWGPKMKFSLHNCPIFNSKTDGGDLQILSLYFGKLIFMPKTCFLEVGHVLLKCKWPTLMSIWIYNGEVTYHRLKSLGTTWYRGEGTLLAYHTTIVIFAAQLSVELCE